MIEFKPFPKIARLNRDCIVTEKIDGTNASVIIEGTWIAAASKTRVLTIEKDNFGFAAWVETNKDELMKLGPGQHFGEWWGCGIQRRYGLNEKRFSLFNTTRWLDSSNILPTCCCVVPVLHYGLFTTDLIKDAFENLRAHGSVAAPEFMKPEGIVVYHTAANTMFKWTFEKDEGKNE